MSGRIGILGGAFDPPHDGHVALAREAIRHFGLERLLVRVVADPGHKEVVTPAGTRLRLAELAFASVPGAEVSLDPFARTVDSLEALGLDDPVFLIGADELAAFPTWVRPARVLELARLGAAHAARHRPGRASSAWSRGSRSPTGWSCSRSRPSTSRLPTFAPAQPQASRSTASCRRPWRPRSSGSACTAPRDVRERGVHLTAPVPHRPRKLTDLTSLEQARRIAALCEEKLATDVTVLDMRSVCDYTDYFILATGGNARQTKAITDEVHFVMKRDHGLLPRSVAGEREATWIVADYIDCVLHVFTDETRDYYRLEDLWSDVPKLEAAAGA